MSLVIIRQQLETALATLTPAIDTVFDNGPVYVPVVGQPYQRVNLLFARPDNPTMGDNFYRENGFLQITLCWPVGAGAAGLDARAQMIRTAFPQGRSFTTGKVTTVIAATMEKMPGQVADAHFESAVRIPFFSNVLP